MRSTNVQGCRPRRSQVDGVRTPVIFGVVDTEIEQAAPTNPALHVQMESAQTPFPEHIGCPRQMFDMTCEKIVVIVVEMIEIVSVIVKVVTASSTVTLSDWRTLNVHARRKLLRTPTVAISGLPVNSRSSLQLSVTVCRNVAVKP